MLTAEWIARTVLTRAGVRSMGELAWKEVCDSADSICEVASAMTRGKVIACPRKRPLFIDFLPDDAPHWAETDGSTVWISSTKLFEGTDLYYTMLHEEIHGFLRRVGVDGLKYELSETREHAIIGSSRPTACMKFFVLSCKGLSKAYEPLFDCSRHSYVGQWDNEILFLLGSKIELYEKKRAQPDMNVTSKEMTSLCRVTPLYLGSYGS